MAAPCRGRSARRALVPLLCRRGGTRVLTGVARLRRPHRTLSQPHSVLSPSAAPCTSSSSSGSSSPLLPSSPAPRRRPRRPRDATPFPFHFAPVSTHRAQSSTAEQPLVSPTCFIPFLSVGTNAASCVVCVVEGNLSWSCVCIHDEIKYGYVLPPRCPIQNLELLSPLYYKCF